MLLLLGILALILFGLPWGLVALFAALCLEILEYLFWKRFLRRYRLRSGPETFVGQTATVIDDAPPRAGSGFRGRSGRRARATADAEGETVRITAVDGLTLEVEPDG